MAGDFNSSASASAEANAIKVQGNTINLTRTTGDVDTLERIARFIAPVAYERREAAARNVRVDSLIENAKKMQREFPGWSERRAIMEAAGYRMTNRRAENVAAVLEEALEIINESKSNVAGLSPESMDDVIDGSKDAYDEHARSMWAKLTAGEAIQPGSLSKRTMSILSQMDTTEAGAFRALCSFHLTLFSEKGTIMPDFGSILLLSKDSGTSFNDSGISLPGLAVLEQLGLVSSNYGFSLNFPPELPMPMKLGGSSIAVVNETGKTICIRPPYALTKYGMELSRLCSEDDVQPGTLEYGRSILEGYGLRAERESMCRENGQTSNMRKETRR